MNKLVLVPGIFTPEVCFSPWEGDLRKAFPEVQIDNLARFYAPLNFIKGAPSKGCRRLRDDVIDAVQKCCGASCAILAHSCGGLLSMSALESLGNPKNAQLFSMATPYGRPLCDIMGMEQLKDSFEIRGDSPCLSTTFGGSYDCVVPDNRARCGFCSNHKELPVGHVSFLINSCVRSLVIEEISKIMNWKREDEKE